LDKLEDLAAVITLAVSDLQKDESTVRGFREK